MGLKVIQSVKRALQILEIIGSSKNGSSLREIADQTGLLPSTAHNIVVTLLEAGYLEQDNKRGSYRLGNKIFVLSNTYNPLKNLVKIAEPHMQTLSLNLKETVVLAVLESFDLCLAKTIYSPRELVVNHNDFSGKLHCTATGKLFMAYFPPAKIDEYIAEFGLKRFASKTITEKKELEAELADIRSCGIAIAQDEGEDGVAASGVPIFGANEKVVASLGVSLPGFRFRAGAKAKIIRELISCGKEISGIYMNNK